MWGDAMKKATAQLREFGQSLWLDNITRDLLDKGVLQHYVKDLSVTRLTSNPTIFEHAVKNSAAYDTEILAGTRRGRSSEAIFFMCDHA
jgi:transaldolase